MLEFFKSAFCSGDPLYTAGQILGFVLIVIGFFVYYSKKRSTILAVKLTTDVICVFQQAMIGAFTGSLLNGIAVFREVVFYNRLDKKWAAHRFWLYFFLLLMGLAPVLTWEGWISLFPAVGSICAVIAFYMENPTHIRIAGLGTTILWLLYSVFTYNVGGIIQNVINIISIFVALARDYNATRRKEQKTGEKE
jgi:hypothetical protein